MLGASTIDTFRRLFTSSFLDMGFVNRLFLVPGEGERKDSIPKQIPEDIKAELKGTLLRTLDALGNWHAFPINPDAYALFDQWYHGKLGNEEMFSSVHSVRLDTYAMRFMSLLAVNESKQTVDLNIMEKVIKILNWQYRMRLLCDPIDADNRTAAVEQQIRNHLKANPDGLTEGRLKGRVGIAHYGIYFWNRAISNLKNAGEVREMRRGHTSKYVKTKRML
jgi:hypothetical protein